MFKIGIIGRPNVGKSTLFNRIAGKRIAITDNMPGVTRDRLEVSVNWMGKKFLLIDTAGYDLKEDVIKKEMQEQFFKALDLADFFIVLCDGGEGLHALDEVVVNILRKSGKPFAIAINKVDTEKREELSGEFYKLGSDIELFTISALHGRNVDELLDYIETLIPEDNEEESESEAIKIAVIGRPNVGKSSLINAWLGEERVIVTPVAGTTRDSVDVEFIYKNIKYILTDTAGIRKKSVMFKDPVEKFGYYRSADTIERADIAVAVIDGAEGLNERDVKVISDAWEAGKPVALAVNKWDIADKSDKAVKNFRRSISEKLQFLNNPPVIFISALNRKNCFKIFDYIQKLYEAYTRRIVTSKVNEALQEALDRHQPPVVGTRRLKFYYMTQVSAKPPYFVAFANNPKAVHFSYERFIINVLREKFDFSGVPIKFSVRARSRKEEE